MAALIGTMEWQLRSTTKSHCQRILHVRAMTDSLADCKVPGVDWSQCYMPCGQCFLHQIDQGELIESIYCRCHVSIKAVRHAGTNTAD